QSLDLLIWGVTGQKPSGSSARALKRRALPNQRLPTTTDKNAFEGLFVRLLKPEGAFAADLRAIGYDLDHPQPRYPSSVFLAALNVAHRHVYPELSREDAHRLLGLRFSSRYMETVLGRVIRSLGLTLGAERILMRLPKIVALANPGIQAQAQKLSSSEYRLIFHGDSLAPDFIAGAMEGAGTMRARNLCVEVVRQEPGKYEWMVTTLRPNRLTGIRGGIFPPGARSGPDHRPEIGP
ncbi:MAG TPA: DUF2378 family protein, partial [Myxococcales bacterium]|nr:DUF2378 family protein [Myxococcales bacterium]